MSLQTDGPQLITEEMHLERHFARRDAPRPIQRAAKRAVDVVLSSLILLALLPVIALIALLVVLDSPGPVLYRAQRVGYKGRPLSMLKFRKMHAGAEGPGLTVGDDERFTRVGAWLSRTKLDELPQLWNVLRGDMSLIGPRPESPEFIAHQARDFEFVLDRVRPGMTGLSQLAFTQEGSILAEQDPVGHYLDRILPQKLRLDRLYATRASVALDFRIVLWTLMAVILGRPVAVNRETGRLTLRRNVRRPHGERRGSPAGGWTGPGPAPAPVPVHVGEAPAANPARLGGPQPAEAPAMVSSSARPLART